jgi:hypothetical protein
MMRSLGLLAAMFNGSGGCALGSLGSTGCDELEVCVEAVCEEVEVCVEPWVVDPRVVEPRVVEPCVVEFGPLPVVLPGSGAGGWTSESVSCPAGPTCSKRQSFPVSGSK